MNAALAGLLTICLSTVSSVVLALFLGRLTAGIALVSLGIGMCGAVAWLCTRPARASRPVAAISEWLAAIVFGLFSLRAFCWLIFNDGNSLSVLSPNNLGDMSLHLTYIRYLARGAAFWPENPIFSGAKLHYPLGMDVFNALLTLADVDVCKGLIWVGLAGCFATAVMLLRWGKGFALASFLFNGGLAGFAFVKTGHFLDYQAGMAWKSIPLAMFVTQRGLLYAIPAGLALMDSWRSRWFSSGSAAKQRPMPFWFEALLYSTLPLFHLHTFLFLSALLGSWLLLRSSVQRFEVFKLLALAALPATALVSLVTGLFQHDSVSAASAVHLKGGWMQENEGFFAFWLGNFGVLPLLLAAMFGRLAWMRRISTEARAALAFAVPAMLVFFLACFVMFAPWEWDNTKLMIWCYLAVLPFLWDFVLRPLFLPLRALCCAALFFSGFVSLWGGLNRRHTGYPIAQRRELASVQQVVKDIAPDETFAAFPTYNHPLLLSGCKVAEGYPGHLMSHGIPYQEREALLRSLMLGETGWRDVARSLHIRYVFWGKREVSGADGQEGFRASSTPWRDEDVLVVDRAWGELYRLHD